jgi:hypothetical protein
VKHALYEDPVTHKFAMVRLPTKFVVGDTLPVSPVDRWFDTRDAAVAALSELFNEDEGAGSGPTLPETLQ